MEADLEFKRNYKLAGIERRKEQREEEIAKVKLDFFFIILKFHLIFSDRKFFKCSSISKTTSWLSNYILWEIYWNCGVLIFSCCQARHDDAEKGSERINEKVANKTFFQ